MSPRVTDLLSRVVLLAGAVASVATDCPQPFCDDDDECEASCQRAIERAAQDDAEAAAAPPAELAAAGCTEAEKTIGGEAVSERPHCACDAAERSFDLWGDDRHCLVVARNATCLMWAWELPRDLCVPGDEASCTSVCDDLETRLIDDAARPVTRTFVQAECEFNCYCIADIDGACYSYVNGTLEGLGPGAEVPCP